MVEKRGGEENVNNQDSPVLNQHLSLGQDLCFTALRNSQGNLVLTLKEVEGKFGEDMLYSFRLRWPTTELRN